MVLFSTTGFEADFSVNGKQMHSNYGLAIEPQEIPDIVHFPNLDRSTSILVKNGSVRRFIGSLHNNKRKVFLSWLLP